MKRIVLAIMFMTLIQACSPSEIAFDPCDARSSADFGNAIACYRQITESQLPQYAMTGSTQLQGVEQRTYRLMSQSWSPGRLVQPQEWLHDVTLYIPDNVLRGRALLVVNNGTRYGKDGALTVAASDFTAEALVSIAKNTKTVVVSVSDVPNQFLVYADDGKARAEDDGVAHSWTLFMDAPQQRATMSLHVPVVASITRAMTLAERELASLDIHRFVVSGISKRAWGSWLAVVADPRIDAVVPFAIDLLGTREALKNIYRTYGGNWPIAFYPYYAEGIDRRIDTQEFSWLMQIEDPLSYLDTRYASRLDVPKYIVNASGDDLFVPDNPSIYYDRLPGSKVLRIVPNSSHNGIRSSTVQSLSTFINRLQQATPLPRVDARLEETGANATILFRSSEHPAKLLLWSAINPDARDFRYTCGIRYVATPIDASGDQTIRVPVNLPRSGWSASFIEATFADGFVSTSQTYILGRERYPLSAPPTGSPGCRTLPGRDVRP
ncbi:PhoPQ-activated pathogenicity-related family protein [Paraburkholderia aspalathi]|uniref:PhoPQ-activated pathogenicity-related family protein n=1 Tax=Paraburkholderia aspalathi TaxID=1324617 RepID=UPI0038BA0CC6